MVTLLHPRVRGACGSEACGTETAEVQVPWSGGHRGAEAVPKIAEVWWWQELPKCSWREQPKMAEVWREFLKCWWQELLKGQDWKVPKRWQRQPKLHRQ